jgi:hypothetical protein
MAVDDRPAARAAGQPIVGRARSRGDVMLADLEALVAPTIMCILFIALIRTILKAQNPQRREANRQREADAEAADPRIDTTQSQVWPDARPKRTGPRPPRPEQATTDQPT